MAPIAYQVHRTRERLRLRIPERRYDERYFATLGRRLSDLSGVREVSVNAQTAGVLLRIDPEPSSDPMTDIQTAGLLRVVAQPATLSPALTGMRRAVDRVDQTLEGFTGGLGDLRTLAFALLMILALGQAARGQLLAPAASLLWYAFDLVRFARPAPEARAWAQADTSGVAEPPAP
jgi:hypothetical protein